MKNGKVGIGFVGVGCISDIYLKNCTDMFCEIEVVGVCDLIRERAEEGAKKYGISKIYGDMYELFADPEVDIVLNITRPYEHYEVTKAALMAGKHVFSEKPLSPRFEEGVELVNLAKSKGLMLGGAPDTFLGAGCQEARRLIDSGEIGDIVGARAMFCSHGPEFWHENCEFIYKYGGGPMLDMGPYYVTHLVNLLGRAKSVMGYTKVSFKERPMLCGPKEGKLMRVEVPTYTQGVIEFECGAIVSLFCTFDIYSMVNSQLEIYGTTGTIKVPDPNGFGGVVKLMHGNKGRATEYTEVPLEFNYQGKCRGLGLADMAKALSKGRTHRCHYEQQLHVLEIMTAFEKSSTTGKKIVLTTPYSRPTPMNPAEEEGYLD